MELEKSYVKISPYFNIWSKIMELRSRKMEVSDSKINNLNILILSPPTDIGIKLLCNNNTKGTSYYSCFSSKTSSIAKRLMLKQNLQNLKIQVSKFLILPFDNDYFDAVFANCVFDFCQEDIFDTFVLEIKRVLKNEGLFFSVYMDYPRSVGNNLWKSLFEALPFISRGCHPVDIKPSLLKYGFKIFRDISYCRFWFPIKYIQAVK